MKASSTYITNLLSSTAWTAEDSAWLKSYLEANNLITSQEDAEKLYQEDVLAASLSTQEENQPLNTQASAQLLKKIHERIGLTQNNGNASKLYQHNGTSSSKFWSLKLKWISAAAILIAISSTIVILNLFQDPARERSAQSNYANDINPGTYKASIKLPNGKTFALSSAKTGVVIDASKLTYNDGTKVQSSLQHWPALGAQTGTNAEGVSGGSSLSTLTTPRGGQYQIKLADGSVVFLNAGSSLTFPVAFSGKERRVLLKGEAYFRVVHNSAKPFRVQTAGQVVEDIGTEFNINAYDDESTIKTTLIEGSASVNGVILTPGKQSTLHGQTLQVKTIDPAEAIDWKNNEFVFNDEPLESVMRKVSRWYNVDVIYQNESLKKGTFWGSISRFSKVSELLNMLAVPGNVKFKIEGRKVYVFR